MSKFSDKTIIDSWQKNATAWTVAVRDNQIETRTQVTNQAIVDAVISVGPKTVLDIGCGEGWLARELCSRNISVVGLDVVPELIARAHESCSGQFQVMSYEQIAEGGVKGTFDVVVCNFSLLGKESVEGIFKVVPTLLNQNGYFIVQTVHPAFSCEGHVYKDGWREGSWQGFSSDFTDPAPWYFRTIESWLALFRQNGLELVEMREPVHTKTGEAASLIMMGCRSVRT
ncbi:MAG: methyltransferase domain-containing protein [Sneathiellales bacterium]|nr:methyltransferase domain-containing protein [Sneathiellales bacterium]